MADEKKLSLYKNILGDMVENFSEWFHDILEEI